MKNLDAAAMDRIIAAAGAEPANRENLRRSLLRCNMDHGGAVLQGQDNKGLGHELDRIAKKARPLCR